ncbi:MAG: LacI family DNA-binding transcriptional regulator [Fusobacteriaceae bacterium]
MVTIKKIAEIAGVSHATVSMVINNRKGPSQVLREKIKKIIEETGYVPNIGARNLVMKKGSNVGIFLLNFPEKKEDRLFYYYIELLEDIMLKMREKGYTLLFYTDRDRTRREISYADYCREQNLMSAIFLGMDYDDPNLEELKKLQSTQVIMFDLETGGEYNTIISDSSSGISEMMECLERNGKKRLAVVTGSMDSIISTQKKMDIIKKNGEKKGFQIEFFQGDFYKNSGYQVGKKIDPERFDSIFAMNDAMAIGVMEAFRERGIRVPEDIGIVGYDNMLFTDYITPKLSSISHDGEGITEALFQMIEGEEKGKLKKIKTKFIIKESII